MPVATSLLNHGVSECERRQEPLCDGGGRRKAKPRRSGRAWLWGAVVGMWAFSACSDRPLNEFSVSDAKMALVERPRFELRAVSAEEAHELADALVTAAYDGNVKRISALFDLRATVLRALAGMDRGPYLDDADLETVTATVRRRFELVGLAHSLAQIENDHSELRLLRETQAGEGRWLALRRNSEKGVEHLDLLLSLGDQGQPVIVDYRLLSAAKLMSAQLRDYDLLVALGQQSDVHIQVHNELDEQDNTLLAQHASLIRGSREASATGRYQDALRLWDQLPEPVRGLLPSLVFEFELALEARDQERYRTVFAELERRYGDEPAVAMPRLDYYLATEELPKALEAVDLVARHAISDPYFDVIRSNILTDMHNPRAAKEAALRALQSAPDLKDAYWNLVAVSLNERDFEATAGLLLEMREKFSLEYSLEMAPVFADFVASPYYERFLRGTANASATGRMAVQAHQARADNKGAGAAKRGRVAKGGGAGARLAKDEAKVAARSTGQATSSSPGTSTVAGSRPGAARHATGPVVSQYTEAVQRMAAARVKGHARARAGEAEKPGDSASYEVTNTVMNVALGTEY